MREIRDRSQIATWRWQLDAFTPGGGFAISSSGTCDTLEQWRIGAPLPDAPPGNPYHDWRLCLCAGGSLKMQKGFCEYLKKPDFLTVRMVSEGDLYVSPNNARLLLFEPGDICLLPPFCSYAQSVGPAGYCVNHYLAIGGQSLDAILQLFRLQNLHFCRPPEPERFMALHRRAMAMPRRLDLAGVAANAGFCTELLELLSAWRPADLPPERFTALLHFMDEHCGEELPVRRLAAKAGSNTSWVYQNFRRYLDTSPHQYLKQRRMELARGMLEAGRSVKETSLACGYSTPFNFSAEFKRYFGVAPRNFRR